MDTEGFVKLIQAHAVSDYESAASVRLGNKAADQIRNAVLSALSTPTGTGRAIELLNNSVVAPWIAFTAMEHGVLTEFQRARCLSVIRSVAAGDGVDAIGAKAWLAEHGCEA